MDFAVTFKQLLPNFAPFFFKNQNYINTYKVLFAQLCLTPCNPMDCSLPDSSVHGIFKARILEWAAIPFSRGSS